MNIGPHGLSSAYAVNVFFAQAELYRETKTSEGMQRMKVPKVIGWFLELFIPRKKQLSLNDKWALKRKQNQYLFMFYVIIYLFYQDDGMVSKQEQRIVHKLIKKSRRVLEKKHYKQVIEYSKHELSKHNVVTYVETHKLTSKFIDEAMLEIKKLLRKQDVYKPFIKSLEQSL